jgi:membrane fusion protein, multidrug efflux system
MKRIYWIPTAILVAATATIPSLVSRGAAASESHGPSVLATLAPLHKGDLPKVVTAYGTIGTSAKAKRTVTAPSSAIVMDINVKSGAEVSKGAPLIKLGPSPGTVAAFARAKSALQAAQALVQRTQDLLNQHLATRQQLVDAQKSASDAKATIAALKAEGAASPQTLRAPFKAIVTNVPAELGAVVNQGTPLVTLARPSGLVLNAGVVPAEAAEIRNGQTVKVTPLGATHVVSGKVTLRGSIVDPHTGLVPIEISLPTGSSLPGQTAQAKIQVGQVAGYIVPHEAILVNDHGEPFVVQSHNMIAHKVLVRVLLSAGDRDVIAGPLDPKALLVLAGNYQLQNGGRIRVADPKSKGR